MKVEVRVTESAWADVFAIVSWITKQGAPLNASRWFNGVVEVLESLGTFPERCGHAPEHEELRGAEIRQLLHGEFRILFTLRAATLFVIHVRRCAMLPVELEELSRRMAEVDKDSTPAIHEGDTKMKDAPLTDQELEDIKGFIDLHTLAGDPITQQEAESLYLRTRADAAEVVRLTRLAESEKRPYDEVFREWLSTRGR